MSSLTAQDDNGKLLMDEYLREFKGLKIVYCPNPGNAGDSLIAAATLQIFARHQIEVEWASPKDVISPGQVVVYGGGGNLVPAYPECREFVLANHRNAERFILLPQTVDGNEDLLGLLGGNVDLITRESLSYAHCRSHARKANVYRAEDLALSLDVAALRSMSLPRPASFRPTYVRPWRLSKVRHLFRRAVFQRWFAPWTLRNLQAFRLDAESRMDWTLVNGNLDLSDIFMYRTNTPEAVWNAARHLVDFLSFYQHAHTDRLHVCIASALLGKDVSFYPNSYFKNEAVFRDSIAPRFPKVRWMGNSLLGYEKTST